MDETVKDVDDFDFNGIEFKLGKKIRNFRLTIPGMKLLSKYFGSVDEAFNQFDKLENNKKGIMNEEFLDMISKFTHACVIHEEKCKLETIENELDFHILMSVFVVIRNVIQGSMPKPKKEEEVKNLGESKEPELTST